MQSESAAVSCRTRVNTQNAAIVHRYQGWRTLYQTEQASQLRQCQLISSLKLQLQRPGKTLINLWAGDKLQLAAVHRYD